MHRHKFPNFDKINNVKLDLILKQMETYKQVGRAQPSFMRQQLVTSGLGDKYGDPPGVDEDGLHTNEDGTMTPPRKDSGKVL